MKVYVDDLGYRSPSVRRVIEGFKNYSPAFIEIANSQEEADIVLVHVYGRIRKVNQRLEYLQRLGKKYVIIQYTLRCSLNPSTLDWLSIWNNSIGVWSYLNLKEMLQEDGERINFNFYYAPLGVDRKIFYPLEKDHYYQICTTGVNYMTEGVRECVVASRDIGKRSVHIGTKINIPSTDSFINISDELVTKLYNRSDYVAGMRRNEGFELPAAEGLICGVRPIMFDREYYREWYDGLAIFIPQNSREETIENLKIIFKGELRPVTTNEIQDAQQRFDWERLLTGFWNSVWTF